MRISLVIPTRERAEYLAGCMDTVLSSFNDELEIVVSDNCSSDNTARVVAKWKDPRLLYTKVSERCSMRRNFEHGLRAASGDYVMFIGDDDGLIPSGFEYLRQLLELHRPDAVGWTSVQYIWPSDFNPNGYVVIKPSTLYRGISRKSCSETLNRALSGRLDSYRSAANIYHGCISRRLIDKVQAAQGGVYFRGASPDVYAAVANLAQMSEPLVWAGHPVTIGGISPRSNGYAHMSRFKVSEDGLREIASFKQEASFDSGAASIDLSMPSVDAVTLDMLDLALSGTHYHCQIDRRAWVLRIRKQLVRLPRSKYEHGSDSLRNYCRHNGLENDLLAIEDSVPFVGPERATAKLLPRESKLRLGRITLVERDRLRTVAHAAMAIEEVLGSYTLNSGLRWANWLAALRRAKRWCAAQPVDEG